MPVATRSRITAACGGGDGAQARGSASAAPAPRHDAGAPREGAASHHHHGLKEKMRALTLLYEQHKQQLAASQAGGAAARQHRRSIRSLNAAEVVNDENAKNAEEGEGGEVAMRRHDAFALVPETAVLRENVAPPAPPLARRVPSKDSHVVVFARPAESQEKGNVVGRAGNAMSCPIKKAVPAIPVLPVLPVPAARKLSLGGAVGGKFKAAGEVGAGSAEAAENRILVFVRLRPMSRKEKEAGSRSCVKIVNKEVYLTEYASENDYLRLKRVRGRHFCFDSAFPDPTTQAEVYSTSTADLVEGVLQGRNGTVFCYGATGAGKTYTMLGTMENPGVMVLAIKDLFSKVRQRSHDGNHSIQLSYLEVYNETVRDLLSPGRPLHLREDKQGTVAAGLTQYRAYSTDEVMKLLQQGNKNRTTEPTRVNETSSRSHAILQVVVEYRSMDGVNIVTRVGKLSLIDLAGSERALATDQRTQRSIEGANINRSLLALSSCINALVEGKKHIPYRNSKLTQLLKDSLGGSCNTVMIANISPSNLSFGETQNTLHWADRAKEIKTKAITIANEEVLNVPDSETDQAKLLLELQKENSVLREQLVKQQQKLLTVQAQSLASNTSPQQSPAPSSHISTPCSTQRKVKRSIMAGNCFSTPDSKRPAADNAQVRELQRKVKTLEADIEKMKKEHILQLKQKDEFIRDLINRKASNYCEEATGDRRVVTRASLRKAQKDVSAAGELKSPSHRFTSPAPTAKKRTFWDIGGNSPSVLASNGRKTRSHVATETPKKGPSMLLQPGFARQRAFH
ncbi:Kinesin-like protein KIF19 [Dichanthelium oligosanthes]|uniref:Kinesin-like protein n=1 Tax=Dichanthelium oligosanthes TaxID=888268 RepID=A0A1E5VML9_9POAL|nr:Kinesin-like protein KIF19 [Dichanthelium oligosanthes]